LKPQESNPGVFFIGEKCVPHFSQIEAGATLGAPAKSVVFAG